MQGLLLDRPHADVIWGEEHNLMAMQVIKNASTDVVPSLDVVWDADLQLAQRTEEMMC